MVHRPAASALPESLTETQNLRPMAKTCWIKFSASLIRTLKSEKCNQGALEKLDEQMTDSLHLVC